MTVPSPRRPQRAMVRQRSYTRAVVLFVLSLSAFAVGIIYFIEPAQSLPQFLPGRTPGSSLHQISAAVVCAFAAVVLFFAACINLAIQGPLADPPVRVARDAQHVRSIPLLDDDQLR